MKPQERKTALLFQNYQLFPNLTVEQNVAAGLDPKMDAPTRTSLVNDQLVRFGLEKLNKRYPLMWIPFPADSNSALPLHVCLPQGQGS